MLDWTGIWGVRRPGRSLGLFVMFLQPFLNESQRGREECGSTTGACVMSYNVYMGYIYQRKNPHECQDEKFPQRIVDPLPFVSGFDRNPPSAADKTLTC